MSFSSPLLGTHEFASTEMALFPSTLLFALLLSCTFALFLKLKTKKPIKSKAHAHPQLPPGPSPWPIVGNLPEVMRNKPTFRWMHALMQNLKTDIACFRLANVHVITVTSPELSREFLKKNDAVFASRPRTMATEYSSSGYLTIAVNPWGGQWKKMRKVVASDIINQSRLRWLADKRTQEADNLVRFIYNQCHEKFGSVVNLRLVVRQYSGNVIRRMMFGKRYFGEGKENGGPGLEEEEHVESLFTVLMHLYSFIVSDYIPWMRVFDLEGHENIVSNAMKVVTKYHDPIIDKRVKHWNDGKRREAEDLLDAFILAKDANGMPALSVEEIKAQCIELMLATVDNPSQAVEWAMAEMLNQTEILRKAVEEIDRVVGKDRLVQESDIPQLNYVKACIREAFRLHPIAPFNLPHLATSDAVVGDYFIPKGSHVLLSRLGLGRNSSVWEEPLKFKPERHLKEEGSGDIELTEPELKFISFSVGRRGCMGISLGSSMTVMLLARLLQGFNWSVPPPETKIDLSESENDLFLAKPLHAYAIPRLHASLY